MSPPMVPKSHPAQNIDVFVYYLDVRHLWRSDQEFHAALQMVPEADRIRISNLLYEEDSKMALASQLLQIYVVSMYSKRTWHKVQISRTESGRPFVPNAKFDFNVSHQNGYVAIAVKSGGRVGIDITDTNLENADAYVSAISPLFSHQEMRNFETSPYPARLLFHYWALKEATVKMLGTGMSNEFASIELNNVALLEEVVREGLVAAPSNLQIFVKGHLQRNWNAVMFLLDTNLVGAVITNGPPHAPVVLRKLNYADITRCWHY